MTALEFLRVLFAFMLVFLALPLLSEGHRLWRGEPFNRPPEQWIPIILRSFVLASFVAEILCLVLGSIRLCLPGLVITASVLWCARGFLIAHQIRSGLNEEYAQSIWRPIIALLEPQQSSELQNQLRAMRFQPPVFSPSATLVIALLTLMLFAFTRPAILQVSFDHPESYVRTVSLAALSDGRMWSPDGSVAFLAPVVFFSGLDAASVVRFTGPILVALFAGLMAICAWHVWRISAAAVATLALFFCVALSCSHSHSELIPGLIAVVYWSAAAILLSYSWKYSLVSAAIAIMIAPEQWIGIAVCFLLVASMHVSFLIRSRLGSVGTVLASALSILLVSYIISLWNHVIPDPQLSQYESAARTCRKITRQFHRNEWLVVSPFQELAFTYGHGWHVELSQFVSRFHQADVSKPKFSFPYEAADVFFFVERKPLRLGSHGGNYKPVWRYAPAESTEWSSFLYGDPLGRASLEYQAAELLNNYAASHKNLTVFYQDDDVAVYHLAAIQSGG